MNKQYLDRLPEDAKRIKGTLNWCDTKGNIYGKETRKVPNRFHKNMYTPVKNYNKYFKYAFSKIHQGYYHCSIKYIINGKFVIKTRRINIIIAETFIDNPNNLPIVGHKNNIKTDNRVENLYWTTYSENSQKAVDDGLLINAKGYDDSQSKPVAMYETSTNKLIAKYGSIKEAVRKTGIPLSTVSRQCRYKRPNRKKYYFRFQDEKY